MRSNPLTRRNIAVCSAYLVALMASLLGSICLLWGGEALAACSGPCGAESGLTGLAHPPAWATGRRVHFEPESAAASAYAQAKASGLEAGPFQAAGIGAESEGGEPLLYHEGGSGVQHTPKVYVIFWGTNFETTTAGKEVHAMLLKLYEGLTSTGYQGILTQYFDATGRVSSTVAVTSYIDTGVQAPKQVNRGAVEKEIANAIEANKWTSEQTAQFVVVPAPGSTYESGFPGGCAYHEYTSSGVIYALVPYQGDKPFSTNGCVETGNPSKNPVRKTSKSASHEYAETATDPRVNAWYAASGQEIADICSSEEDLELPDGAWAQNQYDNHQNKCAHEDLSPPHVYTITQAAANVQSTEAKLNGIVNPEGVETQYHFEYGTTTSYGSHTPEVGAGSGVRNQTGSQTITGLAASTTYHFRVVATNSTGPTDGMDHTFTTTGSHRRRA